MVDHPQEIGGLVVLRNLVVYDALTRRLEGLLFELAEFLFTDKAFPALVDSQEEIEHEAHHGKEKQEENPRQRLHRVAVLSDEDHDDAHQQEPEQYSE